MKTQKQNYLKAFLVGFIFLMSNVGKSQIAWPYPVTNSLTCDVVICYEFHDDHMCTFVCIPCPLGGIVVKAGTTVNIGATMCNN